MELISVIVPVYNVEEYLDECVQSIVNQTHRKLEIILVDDGSTDKCSALCEKWAKKDNRIKVVHKTNGGLSSARNAGLEIAKGEYIGFVDSDDWINPTMYELLLNTCKINNTGISCCGRTLVYEDGLKMKTYISSGGVWNTEHAISKVLRRDGMDVAAWDKLYKSELFDNIRFPEGENNEDTAVFYKLFEEAKVISHSGTCEYFYRVRLGSITQSSYQVKNRESIFKHLNDLGEFINDKYPQLQDDYLVYKSCNLYHLLNLQMKCEKDNIDEHNLLWFEFKRVKKNFLQDATTSIKDKMIVIMISMKVYPVYLSIKRLLKNVD